MKKIFYTIALLLFTSVATAEEPIKLSNEQMDGVVAGQQVITDPGVVQPVLFPDSFFSGNGPLQVTGVEMVMPGDNVSVVRDAVDAFLKAKKAF